MTERVEAVISGIGGRFPKCDSLQEFASRVLSNEYLVSHSNRWREDLEGVSPWVGENNNFKAFDHSFFGLHSKVAFWSDPVYRGGYERALEAIIDAGINPESLRGSPTKLYYTSVASDFNVNYFGTIQNSRSMGYAVMGLNQAMAANRISYIFDLRGESVSTGGSESVTQLAFQNAVKAITSSQCDCVLIVVSCLANSAHFSKELRNLGLFSEDGVTRCYDETGTGWVRSDSQVAFLVQRGDQAKRCYAKVVDSDMGFAAPPLIKFDPTLPNPVGMERFLSDMYRRNKVDPADIAYVEGSGNGSPLLDRAELQTLGRVLGASKRGGLPLSVSSAMSNVANTDSASAAVSICRAVVAMESNTIPATINCSKPIEAGHGDVQIVTKNQQLSLNEKSVVAVNSFHFTGSMGHIILKPNLKVKKECDVSTELPRLVPICNRTEEHTRDVAEKIKSTPFDPEFLRLAQDTFCEGIRGYGFQTFVICPPLPGESFEVVRIEKKKLWYVYSGMGSQWEGMGTGLMELPIFRDTIERLHAVLEPKGLNLKEIITERGPESFNNILKSFVGITACQIALTNVLNALGLSPEGIIGHSVGELGCAYADDCLTEEQTILAAWARGVASNEATLIKGMMAAVGMGYKDILGRLPPTIDVACRNSSTSCTLSGPVNDVHMFVKELSAEGIFARAVNVSDIAYHSRYIQPAAPFLRKHLESVIRNPKRRSSKWLSTSAPKEMQHLPAATHCSAEYQTNNLLNPVLFEDVIKTVPKDAVLVEIAPHGLMQAILKRELINHMHISLCQRNSESPIRTLLTALGKLHLNGMSLKVSNLYPEVSFPVSRGTPSLAPLVRWEHENSITYTDMGLQQKVLSTHKLENHSPYMLLKGVRVFPLSEMLNMVKELLRKTSKTINESSRIVFRDVHVLKYPDQISQEGLTYLVEASLNHGSGQFEVILECIDGSNNMGEEVILLAHGYVFCVDNDSKEEEVSLVIDPVETLDGREVLSDLASQGLAFSGKYNSLASIDVCKKEWIINIQKEDSLAAIIEAAIQAALLQEMEQSNSLLVTRVIKRLEVEPKKLLGKDVTISYNLQKKTMQAPGFFMTGLSATDPSASSLAPELLKLPMNLQFVPFGKTNIQNVGGLLTLAVQLALENVSENNKSSIMVLELLNGVGPNVLGPAVLRILQEQMGIQAEVKTLTVGQGKKLSLTAMEEGRSRVPCLIVSGPSTLGEGARLVAHTGGLLLTRSPQRPVLPALRVLAEQQVGGDWVSILCRPTPLQPDTCFVHMASTDPLPARLQKSTVLVWRGQPVGGVASTVEEVKKRSYNKDCRLVFLLDENAPEFSASNAFFMEQLVLNQFVNVLRWGVWGSWRAIPLPGIVPAALSASRLGDLKIDAVGLNPHDKKTTSGKSMWSGHIDYVGCLESGERVMGVARWASNKNRPKVDSLLRWHVPDAWSDKDAATVPYAYAVAYHALCVMTEIEPGSSILIHEGASAVGQAAIRIALQRNCSPIFVTVASESQRSLLRKHFPQIDQKFVLSCDESFEWHIRKLTHTKGVRFILNTLNGRLVNASLSCLGQFGCLVHYGREDMLQNYSVGLQVFLKSISFFGVSGDHIFDSLPKIRKEVVKAVQEGIESGVVQPIIGAKMFSAPRLCSPEDARWIREDSELNKAVIQIPRNGLHGPQECSPDKTYAIVGGDHHEWLQVAGWLSLQGARKILAVPGGKSNGALVRHRQRSFRQQYSTSVRVEEIRSWDKLAAEKVVQAAASTGPIDAFIVILKDEPASRIPALLHAALTPHPEAGLLILTDSPHTACGLSSLCEARRDAGLRTACLSGRLDQAAEHLVDMLSGVRPAVTILPQSHTPSKSFDTRLMKRTPATSGDLAAVGKRLAALPPSGIRLRGLRGVWTIRENLPIFALPPLGVMESDAEVALAKQAIRVTAPIVGVEYRPNLDIHKLASTIAQELTAVQPAGPFNLLGWGVSNPLTLEVSRRLEDLGHNVSTFLLDGDVITIRDWAASVSDLDVLNMVFAEDEGVPEVSEETLQREGWSRLLPRLVSQCGVDPSLVQQGVEAVRLTLQGIAKHQPRVDEPVRFRLISVSTCPTDTCSFKLSDEKLQTTVMPQTAMRDGFKSYWLGFLLNENSTYSKLSNPHVIYKTIFQDSDQQQRNPSA